MNRYAFFRQSESAQSHPDCGATGGLKCDNPNISRHLGKIVMHLQRDDN